MVVKICLSSHEKKIEDVWEQVLRNIYGPKRNDAAEKRIKSHTEKLRSFYTSKM
jgi:hypothetical protein